MTASKNASKATRTVKTANPMALPARPDRQTFYHKVNTHDRKLARAKDQARAEQLVLAGMKLDRFADGLTQIGGQGYVRDAAVHIEGAIVEIASAVIAFRATCPKASTYNTGVDKGSLPTFAAGETIADSLARMSAAQAIRCELAKIAETMDGDAADFVENSMQAIWSALVDLGCDLANTIEDNINETGEAPVSVAA